MKLSEFNYELPKELIAQEPLKQRDEARLMVVERATGRIHERLFRDIVDLFEEGSCVVLNDTRVLNARLFGRRQTGGKVEIFVLDAGEARPRALVRSSGYIRDGEKIGLEGGGTAVVGAKADVGRFVEFDEPLKKVLEKGHVPLPPYISREDSACDRDYYQTVYAAKEGATASPTAGLHFTRDLLGKLRDKGVETAFVTLHTSYGTFAPVKCDNIEEHRMHSEYFEIDNGAAGLINRTKANGKKVFAVGTTSARVLETAAAGDNKVAPAKGATDLFIYPGYCYRIIDGLITNFHLPCSTLVMLVSAFCGKELMFEAYKKAVESRFRFFSYGDAMMIM